MKTRLTAIALCFLALLSCDKAKDFAGKASSAVKEQIAAKTGGKVEAEADPELRKLVDQTPEGTLFRKDLPFPARLEVRTTRIAEISGRMLHSSAIENRSETINGTQVHVAKLERASNQVRYTLEESGFSKPSAGDPDAAKKLTGDPLDSIAHTSKPVTFRKTGDVWKSDDSDGFRAVTLSRDLSPVFDHLLTENALAPKPLWFGKRRMKPGDQLAVTGDSMPMLFAGKAKGSLTLVLDSFQPVAGHPCGVFTIKGDYSRKQFPDFEGNLTDEDVTIQSGKIWLSLIYPIVLREELDTIQTFKTGGQGGAVGRGQGTVKVSVKREWKKL